MWHEKEAAPESQRKGKAHKAVNRTDGSITAEGKCSPADQMRYLNGPISSFLGSPASLYSAETADLRLLDRPDVETKTQLGGSWGRSSDRKPVEVSDKPGWQTPTRVSLESPGCKFGV